MASQEQLECTQIIQTSPSEDASSQEQVASLILNGLEHPIFNGTKIGRDPKQCSVAIDRKSVSFHHALIEVELGQHFLSDLGSTNSTHLNGLRLKPNIKYEVPDGAVVQVADLCGTYHILPLKEPELETTAQDIFDPIMSSTLAMNLDESDLADESNNFHLYLSTIVDSSFEGVTPFVTAKSSLEVSAVSVPSVSEPTGPVFLRRSSRIKERQAKQGKDFSGESQSQESGLPDQVSAASSSDHTKGRKSGRDTKQKVNTKSGPSVA